MLITTPLRLAFIEWVNTALDIWNVPSVSISITVLKALLLIFSAEAKKLPAAPFNKMSTLSN